MNFCSQCGKPVTQRIPEGDARLRYVCDHCSTIHYQNPNIVAGTVPVWGDQVLLCLRNIEPRRGKWTLPAGFMELGETTQEGAARETVEEAGAQFSIGPLFSLLNVPRAGQVDDVVLGQRGPQPGGPLREQRVAVRGEEERVPALGPGLQVVQPVAHVSEHSVDIEDCHRHPPDAICSRRGVECSHHGFRRCEGEHADAGAHGGDPGSGVP